MSKRSSQCERSDFYVGYLPMPGVHRRFLSFLVPALLLGCVGIAMMIAGFQRDPGASLVSDGKLRSWTGTLFQDPYPMLITESNETYLIMGIGKFGVSDRTDPFDAQHVVIDGWELARAGRSGIQLDPGPDSIRFSKDGSLPTERPAMGDPVPVSIIGEIVDGKCFIGAMKPGDGKAHKACATLCIDGGLPPLFAEFDQSPSLMLPLVLVDGSANLPPEIKSLIGEPVILEGTLEIHGGLRILRTGVGRVHRWNGSVDAHRVPEG